MPAYTRPLGRATPKSCRTTGCPVAKRQARKKPRPARKASRKKPDRRRQLVYPESRVIAPGRNVSGHQRRSACVLGE